MSARGQRLIYLRDSFPHLSETFVVNEVVELERRGYEVRVIALQRAREAKQQPHAARLAERAIFLDELSPARRLGLSLKALRHPRRVLKQLWLARQRHSSQSWQARRSLPLAGLMLELAPDRVHCHFAGVLAARGLPAARIAGLPITLTMHGYDVLRRPMPELGQLVDALDGSIVVSAAIARELKHSIGAKKTSRVCPCGVDTSRFRPDPESTSIPGRVLTVARLSPEKDLATAIKAAALLKARGVDFTWHFIGEGPERPQIESLIAAHDLSHHVYLLGSADSERIRSELQACEIFALCSLSEGSPVVLLEAMACARPVIATSVGGIPEIVDEGVNGCLVPAADPGALADAVQGWLSDPALRRRCGVAGRLIAEARFSLRHQVDVLETMWASGTDSNGLDLHRARGADQ